MSATAFTPRPKAIVIGGSLGGLFAGVMLKDAGWDVDIYERSKHDLDSRGGGIVLQPEVVEILNRTGVAGSRIDLGVGSRYRTVFRPDGSIESKQLAPQTQTSWSLIYTTMKSAFCEDRYHQGKKLVDVRQDEANTRVSAVFEDGSDESGDLLIGADGGNSTVRQLLWPEAKPTYSGYLAWRGLVPEDEMPTVAREDLLGNFGFAGNTGSHILGYLVPGVNKDIRKGYRLYNWVWYRVADDDQVRNIMTDNDGRYRGFSVPEGKLAEKWREHVYREAANLLPPAFREVVTATRNPFAQAIRDLTVDTMVKGRIILLGDAAFIPRPHTAASTSKAATNALALAQALISEPANVDNALQRWQPEQLMLGNRLYRHGRGIGNYLLFNEPPTDE